MDPEKPDKDENKQSKPGIPRPGEQPGQEQRPGAPTQPPSHDTQGSRSWIPPRTGNPDLDPAGASPGQRVDLRDRNPLVPQGMVMDPRSLLDLQRQRSQEGGRPDLRVPPGARFDPFGPVDPSLVGPGRGPLPSNQFATPDPDELAPPGGLPSIDPTTGIRQRTLKGFKSLGPQHPFPPPGGAGGPPFL